jgi:hypothetical protein
MLNVWKQNKDFSPSISGAELSLAMPDILQTMELIDI